jgi:hypothetical protein
MSERLEVSTRLYSWTTTTVRATGEHLHFRIISVVHKYVVTEASGCEFSDPMTESTQDNTNPIAIAGLAFGIVALILYGISFWFAGALPDTAPEIEAMRSSPAELTRFVVLAGSAVLLNLVALSLSTAGLLLPRRPRVSASAGVILSGLMLIGVPGVILVGLLGAG